MIFEAINSLTYDSLKTVGQLLNRNKKIKKYLGIILLILVTLLILLLIYSGVFISDETQREFVLNRIVPFFVAPILFVLFILLITFANGITDLDEIQLEKLRAERIEITQKIEKDEKLDIFHTIQLSLNQLNEYYTINKSQAKSSFRFSIFSIVVGLITIICGILFFYFDYGNIQLTSVTTISGIILEFIGGAYFFMYKKSLEQVNFFFGQLIKIQDTMLAINLTKNVKDDIKLNELTDKIISSLLERSLK